MKFIIILLVATCAFAGTLNQKMIISVSKNNFQAEQSLDKLEQLFGTHVQFPQIQTKIEKLNEYFLVTISPIDTIQIKHQLYALLQPKFSKIFTVENIEMQTKVQGNIKSVHLKPMASDVPVKVLVKKKDIILEFEKSIENKLMSFWNRIDSDWIALLALAMAGIMLIFRSNYQIGKIKKLQEELEMLQRGNVG